MSGNPSRVGNESGRMGKTYGLSFWSSGTDLPADILAQLSFPHQPRSALLWCLVLSPVSTLGHKGTRQCCEGMEAARVPVTLAAIHIPSDAETLCQLRHIRQSFRQRLSVCAGRHSDDRVAHLSNSTPRTSPHVIGQAIYNTSPRGTREHLHH